MATANSNWDGRFRHGLSKTPEYFVWKGIRKRCMNPNAARYNRYGGRGICVCSGWNDFATFYADIGPRTTKKHTIDRIDNDGNYSCGHCPECVENGWPMNCRWATVKENSHNSSLVRLLEYRGERLPVTELARRHGLRHADVLGRLRCGWSLEKALTTPIDPHQRNVRAFLRKPQVAKELIRLYTEEQLSMAHIAKQFKVSIKAIKSFLSDSDVHVRRFDEQQRIDNERKHCRIAN